MQKLWARGMDKWAETNSQYKHTGPTAVSPTRGGGGSGSQEGGSLFTGLRVISFYEREGCELLNDTQNIGRLMLPF